MVEISVSQVVAASDFYYGIACRSDATSAYDYEFQIQQGYVQIIKYVNGDPKTLAASSMATWRANGSNQLRVSCTRAGDQNAVHLVFWVNGKKLGDAIDRTSPLANGMVGLITDRTGGTKTVTSVEFDNFVVRRV
jgi:hypothetical protein